MGDSEWVEVNRRKRHSVFDRLHIPHGKASNADDTAKISLSVYVSNFPSHLTMRELRNICGKWGTLVDVFIVNRKNKLGQISDWKLRLHANVAKFSRKNVANPPQEGSVSSRVLGDNMVHVESEGTPSITLQQVLFEFLSIEERENFLKHDGVLSWFSFLKPWHDDFFVEERLIWLEIKGVPLRAWDNDTFTKVCKKWGEVLFVDDTDRCNRLSKRLCIKSSHSLLIFATIMVTVNNVNYAIRVRELCSWTPTFLEENSENDNAGSLDKYEGLEENLMENCHKKEHAFEKIKIALECAVGNDEHQKPLDSDPFGLDSLKQRCGKPSVVNRSESLEFPPGFSPNSKRNSHDSNLSHKLQDDNSNIQTGFSMIGRLEETIRVGLALSLNLDGCEKTLASLIADWRWQYRFHEDFLNITSLVLEKDMKGFHDLVTDTWNNDGINEVNGLVSFKKKLQNLKCVIRIWVTSKRSESNKSKKEHKMWLCSIDVKIDQGRALQEDFCQCRDSIMILGDIDRLEANDIAQKAKVKWAFEDGDMPNHLSLGQSDYLENPFSRDEIKRFVWDYGGDPNRLNTVIGSCVSSEQSVFIKGRNILDGPLVLNEIMAWHRKRKKNLMLGFGTKWRKWIFGCLWNARTSVLVNGSPTCEFKIYKGLRKGDPLSPFLFILAMEGLHVLTCKAESVGLFKGVSFGHHNMRISHFIYVDDVIFLGEWSSVNAHNLLCMLCCFYLISGLKINVNKCNVLGVGVSNEEVSNLAKIIGCGAAKFLMKYLGVPVGGNMARCSNWNAIIQKFSSKLSLWKARLLSVGGRLSLIKSVLGSLPTYYMSIYMMPATVQKKLEAMRNKFFIGGDLDEKKITWVRWKKFLASKELGGLGIGSIYRLNIGLLFKWVWRFLSSPFDLWVRVIKNIHGEKEKGIDLLSLCVRKIGNDASCHFWEDTWVGHMPLKDQFPCIFQLDTFKSCSIADRLFVQDWDSFLRRHPRGGAEMSQLLNLQSLIQGTVLSDNNDSWQWALGASNGYTVASVRSLVDSNLLDSSPVATHWNRSIPIKVNVFIWRLSLIKLPSRVNLDRKGLDVGSILCPICMDDVETVNHIFFSCNMAKDIWSLFAKWWELDIPVCANISEWFEWVDALHISNKARMIIKGVGGTLLWYIWKFRNELIFNSPPLKKAMLWDSIVSQSFLWISSRNPKL
ncbi:RNA-directed DNA polymerase, eukaryota, reverse transcriptase zinc-binding domain protein [Tanacetum coccineum]